MERKLVKGGIYSFIIGLLVGLLVISNSNTFYNGSGFTTEVYDSFGIYIYKLIRFASFLSVITLATIFLKDYVFNSDSAKKAFTRGFLRGFLIVASIIVALLIVMVVIEII